MTGISSVSGTRTSDKDLYSTTKLLGASGCGSPGPVLSLGMFGRSLEYVKTLNDRLSKSPSRNMGRARAAPHAWRSAKRLVVSVYIDHFW